jgi:hypothetical protein
MRGQIMIISDKKFSNLDEANAHGNFIAKNTGWDYIGAIVSGSKNNLTFTAQWRY